jgi:hypothetical protein
MIQSRKHKIVDKKSWFSFFFIVLSGKLGFICKVPFNKNFPKKIGITSFLYQNHNPVDQMVDDGQFCSFLNVLQRGEECCLLCNDKVRA